MLVFMRMIYPAVTINARASIRTSFELIAAEKINTLPVVDRQGRLLGIVTKQDLDQFRERCADTPAILDDTVIEEIMERDVLTVTENTPVEDAARMIVDYGILIMPVVRGGFVVGVIDEKAILQMVMETSCYRVEGVRITCNLDSSSDDIPRLYQVIGELDGRIHAMSVHETDPQGTQLVTMKVSGVEKYDLKRAIAPIVQEVIDIR